MTKLNQNIQEYYTQLPNKIKWMKEVAKACNMSVGGVRKWGLGEGSTRDEKKLEVLHKKTGIPKNKLFSHLGY